MASKVQIAALPERIRKLRRRAWGWIKLAIQRIRVLFRDRRWPYWTGLVAAIAMGAWVSHWSEATREKATPRDLADGHP
jgi:hypothetical protein